MPAEAKRTPRPMHVDAVVFRPNERTSPPEPPGAIQWVLTGESVIASLGGPLLTTLGLDASVLMGAALADDLPAEVCELLGGARFERALRGESSGEQHEFRGRVFHVQSEPRRDASGRIDGCLGTAIDLTGRRQLERALCSSVVALDNTESVTHLGSWTWDVLSAEVRCSPELYAILGIPEGTELTFPKVVELIHPDDRAHVQLAATRAIDSKQAEPPVEFTIVHSDGSHHLMWCDGRPIRDPNGQLQAWHGIVQDITRLRRFEEQSLENERVIRALQNIVARPESCHQSRVEEMLRLGAQRFGLELGYLTRLESDTDTLCFEAVHAPEDWPLTAGTFLPAQETYCARAIQTEKPFVLSNIAALPKDDKHSNDWGVRCYMGTPFHVGNELYGTLCFASTSRALNEVTEADTNLLQFMALWVGAELERLHAGRDLLQSHSRFDSMTRNLPGMLYRFYLEPDGKMGMDYASDGARAIFGLEAAEVVEDVMVVVNMVHPDDKADWAETVAHSAETLEPWKWKGRFVLRDGDTRWVQAASRPERMSDGKVVWDGALLDITAHREVEERARKLESDLAHVTRMQTLGEMASGLAHELNQPLSAIANYSEGCADKILQGRGDTVEVAEVFNKIGELAHRAGQIVQRLRTLVRKGEPCRTTISLNELVSEMLEFLDSDPRLRQTQLECEFGDGLPTILGDSVQLQQVVVNLLRNALDALDAKASADRHLRVVTYASEREVVLEIVDNGCGLPGGDASTIFQAFYSTKDDGLGMGLAICRSIIEAHTGILQAESTPENGTRLRVRLPIAI